MNRSYPLNIETEGFVGRSGGDACTILDGIHEALFDSHPELREIADLMAIEAVLADDVKGFRAIYPYEHWRRLDSEAVRVTIYR